MASGVEELLDMLFEMVDEAKNMPLSSDKCVLERDRALDLIDDIRAQFPVELGEAKKLVASRNDYIAAAKREAEVIRKQAEDKARQMVSEDELLAKNVDGVYSADPLKDVNAVRFHEIGYDDVLAKHLEVMDFTATSLAMERRIPVLLFALKDPKNIVRAIMGETIGTIVH